MDVDWERGSRGRMAWGGRMEMRLGKDGVRSESENRKGRWDWEKKGGKEAGMQIFLQLCLAGEEGI